MEITRAEVDDLPALARLLWLDQHDEEPGQEDVEGFADELPRWWTMHRDSHIAFVARLPSSEVVGMAWAALVHRVPRPDDTNRLFADIQTVFVVRARRGAGLGSALVEAATSHAEGLGARYVIVHSGRRAVPVYEAAWFMVEHTVCNTWVVRRGCPQGARTALMLQTAPRTASLRCAT